MNNSYWKYNVPDNQGVEPDSDGGNGTLLQDVLKLEQQEILVLELYQSLVQEWIIPASKMVRIYSVELDFTMTVETELLYRMFQS